ncbi:hypothetical protein [Escherichia coli]|uniref:hypothetical protein n=1 Tax=Escherichia coli TaxID=562 RepID=UPI0028835194|nr:hypothetical protein [Escherichia coli]
MSSLRASHTAGQAGNNTVCCPYCGSVDPFGYYRNTDRIVTILLALIIVVLLTTVSVSVCILCSW